MEHPSTLNWPTFSTLVVTAAGVLVVDAKRYVDKRPELRVEGGILRPRVEKLMVSGRNRTKLVDDVVGQMERVRAALGDESVEVSGVLCFIDADWPLIGSFFSTRGARVVSPRELSKIHDEASGVVEVAEVRDRIAAAFPVARSRRWFRDGRCAPPHPTRQQPQSPVWAVKPRQKRCPLVPRMFPKSERGPRKGP